LRRPATAFQTVSAIESHWRRRGGGRIDAPPASDPYRRGMAMVERRLVDAIHNLLLPNV